MKKIFFILFLFNIYSTYSQEPSISWMKRYGGSVGNLCRSIIATQDGGYFIGGWSNSETSGVKSEDVIGFNYDYWVIKTNSLGAIEWQKTIGGGTNFAFSEEFGEVLSVVRQTSDGGYLLGGNSDSPVFGNKTEPTFGLEDFWVVKLDTMGNIQWQKDIGGDSADDLFALEITADGGCILGGQSRSGISGNKTEVSRGLFDYWVVKLDALGSIEWQKTIGGSGNDVLTSMVVLENSNYLVAGYSASSISGDKTDNCKGGADFWILEIDNQGTILWQKTIGGSDGDLLYKAIKTADGYMFGGESLSNISFDKTQDSRGLSDYWIVKTDDTGTLIWDKTYGGSNDDVLIDLKNSPNGGFVLAGFSNSLISGDKTKINYGRYDGWIVRINDDGAIVWQKSIGGNDNDGFNHILIQPDSSMVLSGDATSPLSGNITAYPYGVSDYWLVKLEPETLVTTNFQTTNCVVYPNPTTDMVTIAFKDFQKEIEVAVYNSLSQKIDVFVATDISNYTIPLQYPDGIYILSIKNQDNTITRIKVVKK